MNDICALCGEEGGIETVHKKKAFKIRGEHIDIDYEAFRCNKCGEEFINSKSEDDPLARVYRIYRKRHNMLQPEEIKGLRKKYGLTQSELSRVLGWGAVTLSRYENGSLQDKTHDRQLKLLREPQILLEWIRESSEAMGGQRRESLIHSLQKLVRDEHPIERYLEEYFVHDEQSIFTGFKPFSMDKFFNAIFYFCRGGTLKTVINKLLFYADFKHFKEYTTCITGAQYIHLDYGPVPEHYEIYLGKLANEGAIEINEIYYSEDVVGQKYTTIEEPLLTIFSDKELITLAKVKDYFKGFSATAIKKFSHEERGYEETSYRQPISYEYASFLKI
ncbi:MAG: DUF4065 domain-containing protein [Deltaproteobacteria bacterium]|nr:DUF4065 domain-containing protein [Deltaproteobacteria bacterium]